MVVVLGSSSRLLVIRMRQGLRKADGKCNPDFVHFMRRPGARSILIDCSKNQKQSLSPLYDTDATAWNHPQAMHRRELNRTESRTEQNSEPPVPKLAAFEHFATPFFLSIASGLSVPLPRTLEIPIASLLTAVPRRPLCCKC